MENVMQIRNPRYARSLIAAAGLITGLQMNSTAAFAQTSTTDANAGATSGTTSGAGPSTRIDSAADLLAKGKVVQARAILVPLLEETASLSLSDGERHRTVALIAQASRKLKAMTPVE